MTSVHQFSELLRAAGLLDERISYDRLMGLSDPKRITRSSTVRVPPLKFDAHADSTSYYFNVKSAPSTTGLRHKGYIKIFKPKNPRTPLEKCDCECDCGCPDFRYVHAWANKQRGASRVGPQSLNQAWNKAPRIKNPAARPGLCKHLIALRSMIYGKFQDWNRDPEQTTTTSKLDRMVKQAAKLWNDYPGAMDKARARDDLIKQSLDRMRSGRASSAPPPGAEPEPEEDETVPEVPPEPQPTGPVLRQRFRRPVGGPSPSAQVRQMDVDAVPKAYNGNLGDSSVVMGMPTLLEDIDQLLAEFDEAPPVAHGLAHTGDTDDEDGDSETMKLLRQVRDIVVHLAGDDLPPDLSTEDKGEDRNEPGIPVDAVKSREDN